MKHDMEKFYIFCLLVTCQVSVGNTDTGDEPDPCERLNRIELDGQTFRTANLSSPGGSLTCDRNLDDGWYYFHASTGSAMVNRCVEKYHCGTKSPVWLIGDNPAVSEGIVSRQACVTSPHFGCVFCGGGETHCCSEKYDIKVKNCGDNFVYRLKRPTGCHIGYCIGDELPQQCLPPNVTKPQCKDVFTPIPQLTAKTGVRPGDGKTSEIQFHCDNSYDPDDTSIVFDVGWFINSINVKSERLSNGMRKSVLHESDWVDKGQTLGFQLICSLNGSYLEGPIARRMDSKPYYAGLKIRGWDFRLDENSITTFHLTPTVPIIPVKNCEDDCDASFFVSVDEHFTTCLDGTSIPQVAIEDTCGIVFKPRAANLDTMLNFKVAASVDGKYDREQVATVRISSGSLGLIHEAWRGYNESFQVTVVDKDLEMSASRCEILPGSFITTFDGHTHLAREEGEFVLYRNKKRAFQINVFQRQCGSSRTCTCAVAIMSATDGIVIDMCLPVSDPSWKPQLKVIQTGCEFLQGSLRLLQKNDGRGYEIYLPTGGYVEVLAVGDSLSVFMFPSTLDWEQTEGLCGLFNKNCMDDLRAKDSTTPVGQEDECIRTGNNEQPALREYKDVVTSFRVASDHSLYRYTFDTTKYLSPDLGNLYCNCKDPSKSQCQRLGHVESCYPPEVSSVRDISVHHTGSCRRRRSIASNIAYIDDEQGSSTFTFDASYKAQTMAWPTGNGLTEAEARRACEDVLVNSELGKRCSEVQFVDVSDKIKFCAETIKMTDDLNKANIIADSLRQHCMQELRRNVSSWTRVSNPTSGRHWWELPREVTALLCSNNCSRNGECVEGSCQCSTGFIGNDCSIETMTPPDAYYIPKSGLCDVTKESCAAALVVGYNFVYSKTLTCHFRPFGLTSKVDASHLSTFSSEAVFETFSRVVCILPKDIAGGNILGFEVSVSNDGRTQSSPLQVIPFDSSCMDCVTGRQPPCSVKQNVCGATAITKCILACIETSLHYQSSSSQTWSSSTSGTMNESPAVDEGQSLSTAASSTVVETQTHTSLEGSTTDAHLSVTSSTRVENQPHATCTVQESQSQRILSSSTVETRGLHTSHVAESLLPSSSISKSAGLRSAFTLSNVDFSSDSITTRGSQHNPFLKSSDVFVLSSQGVESTEYIKTPFTEDMRTSTHHGSGVRSLRSSSWKLAPSTLSATRLSTTHTISVEPEDVSTATVPQLILSRSETVRKSDASWLIHPTPATGLLHTVDNSNTLKENVWHASATLTTPVFSQDAFSTKNELKTAQTTAFNENTSQGSDTETDKATGQLIGAVVGAAVFALLLVILVGICYYRRQLLSRFRQSKYRSDQVNSSVDCADLVSPGHDDFSGVTIASSATAGARRQNTYAMEYIDKKRKRKTGRKKCHNLDKDVLEFLKRWNLERFAANFEREEITINTLQTLVEDDLTEKLKIPLGPAKQIMNIIQQMGSYEQIPGASGNRESFTNKVYMHLGQDLNHGPRHEYDSLGSAQAKSFTSQNLNSDLDPYAHLSSKHQADDAHLYDSLASSTRRESAARKPVVFVNPSQQPTLNFCLEEEDMDTVGHDFAMSSDSPDGGAARDTKRTNSTASLVSNSSLSSQLAAKLACYDVQVPTYFRCALTQEVMKNPVRASDGYTYERSAILRWQSTHKTSPVTHQPFKNKEIEPCFELRREIKEWSRTIGKSKNMHTPLNGMSGIDC